ncbi:hypothetical protein [Sphaerisporangium sp. TRM90804]|uniref:hypothetical protein n=1 Tax=Sphaerisporangium sp. TRM90804 TaxID=3031113 RepID=UPI002449F77C|nr:hypothetical protein [Sphaerisporangium sp. TRM90804]MDH2426929.1 hypothetical protein [Sphaerisporangium sp. TRM90804]
MEDYQRAFIGRVVERLDAYAAGEVTLPKVVEDLRGLFEVADPREWAIRDAFEDLWVDLDAECDLRTELWAPPGLADDAHLRRTIDALRSWASRIADGAPSRRGVTDPLS